MADWSGRTRRSPLAYSILIALVIAVKLVPRHAFVPIPSSGLGGAFKGGRVGGEGVAGGLAVGTAALLGAPAASMAHPLPGFSDFSLITAIMLLALASLAIPAGGGMTSPGKKYNASFQQTMLRIKDPKVSVPFYEQNFGMKCVHKYDFPPFKFSLYFMEYPKEGQALPSSVPSEESEKYLWSMPGTTIELTHNWGTESDPSFKGYWSGNSGKDADAGGPLHIEDGPVRGFGHIAFNAEDVNATCDALEKAGVKFQKKPDEGRMKGLAFALDPDGYWIEIVPREPDLGIMKEPLNLSQTMMRVKDGPKSVQFYKDMMGMTLVRESKFDSFSLYFLACLSEEEKAAAPDPTSQEAKSFVKKLWQPVIELTYNHGTEKDEAFAVHTGNSDPQGFGHIGYLVDDLDAMCKELEEQGVEFFKKPNDGKMRGLAFALDPDGYRIELIQRGMTIDKDFLQEPPAPAA